MKTIEAAIGVVQRGSKVLITRRKSTGPLAGFWEFPGGKCENGETPRECLARELWEELELRAKVKLEFPTIQHDYAHGHVCLRPFLCLHESGEPKLIGCQEARWIEPGELRQYEFPPANAALIEQIIEILPPARAGAISTTVGSTRAKSVEQPNPPDRCRAADSRGAAS